MRPHHLPVFLLASLSLLLCQCDDGGVSIKIKGLRDEIDQLNHQNYETQQQVSRLQSQIESARNEKKKLEEEKAKAETEREAASKQLDQLKRDFETYKNQYKLSMIKRAPGMKVGDFTSSEGKSYHNVVLREISESQVNFNHEGGIMKLHYKQLPESLQDMLGFLIIPKTIETETKSTLTPRQINMAIKADHNTKLADASEVVRKLRDQRETYTSRLGMHKHERDRLITLGESGNKESKAIDQLEQAIRQIDAQILKAEVDVHAIQNEPIKLKPER